MGWFIFSDGYRATPTPNGRRGYRRRIPRPFFDLAGRRVLIVRHLFVCLFFCCCCCFSLVLLLPSKSIRASLSLCRRSVPLICCCHFFIIIIIIIIFWGFALHAGSRVVCYWLCSDWIFSAFRCARSVTRGIRYLSLSLSLSFSFFFNIFNWPPFYRRWWLVSDAADDRRTAAASPMQRKERNENETRPDETGFFFRLISFVFLCVCVCVCVTFRWRARWII